MEWKYKASFIKVDVDTGVLKAGGKEVIKAEVATCVLDVKWLDESWRGWTNLTESAELKTQCKKAQDNPDRSLGAKGAGKGK